MTSSSIELEQIARSQTRQQILLIILCIVLAASTVITWRSVRVMREANEIQRQLLTQQADAPPKSSSEAAENGTSARATQAPNRTARVACAAEQRRTAASREWLTARAADLTNTYAMVSHRPSVTPRCGGVLARPFVV